MKFCKKCKEEMQYSFFRISKRHKDGYNNVCKKCMSIERRRYYLDNIERHRETTKKYYENNKEMIFNNINKEKKKQNDNKYSLKNKDKISDRKKKYYQKNKELIKEKSKLYYQENKEKINKTSDSKREIRKRSYNKRKYQYVWREILRRTINQLKHEKKLKTIEILGYSYDDLKVNIESKFKYGMTWENHGLWHVDHIIPISVFIEGTSPSIVNSLENLRPLWSNDNLHKSNKIDEIEPEYQYLIDKFKKYITL